MLPPLLCPTVTNKVLRFLDLPRLPPPNNTWTAADTADSTVLWGGEGGSGFRGLGGLFGRKEGPQGGGGSRSQQGGAGESGGSGQAGPSAGDVAKPELCKMHLGTGSKRQFLCEAEAAKVRAAGPRKSNVDGLPPMSPATRCPGSGVLLNGCRSAGRLIPGVHESLPVHHMLRFPLCQAPLVMCG